MELITGLEVEEKKRKRKLVIVGAGGFTKTIIDSIDYDKYEIFGYVDEGRGGVHLGKPIFGPDVTYVPDYENCVYYVCIGKNQVRKKWFERVKSLNLETINIIDKDAFVSENVKIGTGNFIGKNAIVNSFSIIGDNSIINEFTLIAPSVSVGSHCNITTNVAVNGEVTIGDECFIGNTAAINGQLSIGHNVTVGSGASVIHPVEPGCTVVGVPAKVVKKDGVKV